MEERCIAVKEEQDQNQQEIEMEDIRDSMIRTTLGRFSQIPKVIYCHLVFLSA